MDEPVINFGVEDNLSLGPLIEEHFGNVFYQQVTPIKYAVIVETTHPYNKFVFHSACGFYDKQINDLKRAGYTILIMDTDELLAQLENYPLSSIGFLWLRMHGTPKTMLATQSVTFTPENCSELFKSLPPKLTNDATVFLDSCSTGALEDLDNMQFAFAKLTLDKPQIQVVAPSKDLREVYFSVEGSVFSFELLEERHKTEAITVVLGRETKAILQDAMQLNVALETIADQLKASLQINKDCHFLYTFKEKFTHSFMSQGFHLNSHIIELIQSKMKTCKILPLIEELIEYYHANPNIDGDYYVPLSLSHATPLSAAIYHGYGPIVEYLLTKGADLSYSFKGQTIFDFAREVDAGHVCGAFTEDFIHKLRRKQENDQSKMVDIIEHHLANIESNTISQSPIRSLQKSATF